MRCHNILFMLVLELIAACNVSGGGPHNTIFRIAPVEISPSDANGGIGGVDQHLSRMLAAQRRRWCNLPDDLGFTKFLGVLVQESWWKIRSS
jgi:hypothetical protein